MGLFEICVVLYICATLFALTMTYREQRQNGHKNMLFNTIGFIACTVWPLVMAGMIVARGLRLA